MGKQKAPHEKTNKKTPATKRNSTGKAAKVLKAFSRNKLKEYLVSLEGYGPLLDTADMVKLLYLHPNTLYNLRRKNILKFIRVGKKIFYARKWLEMWITNAMKLWLLWVHADWLVLA